MRKKSTPPARGCFVKREEEEKKKKKEPSHRDFAIRGGEVKTPGRRLMKDAHGTLPVPTFFPLLSSL